MCIYWASLSSPRCPGLVDVNKDDGVSSLHVCCFNLRNKIDTRKELKHPNWLTHSFTSDFQPKLMLANVPNKKMYRKKLFSFHSFFVALSRFNLNKNRNNFWAVLTFLFVFVFGKLISLKSHELMVRTNRDERLHYVKFHVVFVPFLLCLAWLLHNFHHAACRCCCWISSWFSCHSMLLIWLLECCWIVEDCERVKTIFFFISFSSPHSSAHVAKVSIHITMTCNEYFFTYHTSVLEPSSTMRRHWRP